MNLDGLCTIGGCVEDISDFVVALASKRIVRFQPGCD